MIVIINLRQMDSETITIMLLDSYSCEACDSNKYTKRMIYKRTVKNTGYSYFRQVHIKFLYNSKFDFTAKSLETNTVVITRFLCKKMAKLA